MNNKNKENTLVAVLSLLESYEATHTQANDAWKSTLWNIYKSRHLRKRHNLNYSSDTYCSASDMREDLTARWTLREESTNNNPPKWISVHDGVASSSRGAPTKEEAHDADDALVTVATSTSTEEGTVPPLAPEQEFSEGLRQRKGGDPQKSTSQSGSQWTVENVVQEQTETANKSPTAAPIDPLELLAGAFPPRELKQAQAHAKKALQLYIDAANLIREIQQQQQTQDSSKV